MHSHPVQLSLFTEETVSVAWTAKHLGVSEVTVLRYREKGLLRGYQLAGRGWWHILLDSVREFEARVRSDYGLQRKKEKKHA